MQVFPHRPYLYDSRSMFPWRLLPLAVAALMVGAALAVQPGCTSTGAPDWPAVERELDLTAADLEILAETADALGKASTAQALQDASQAVRQAHDLIASGQPSESAWGLLDASLDVLAAVAAKEGDSDLALGVAAARIALGRVKAYLPEPEVAIE